MRIKIKKLKASMLLYAIGLALFMALISGSLILMAYYYSLQFEQLLAVQQVQRACDSGWAHLLAEEGGDKTRNQLTPVLIGADAEKDLTVLVERKQWGAYEVGISKSTQGNYACSKIGQFGYQIDSTQNFALYLPERGKVLALAGNTVIRGNVYLPKVGTKRTYIEGQTFTGRIHGKTPNAKIKFPHLDSAFLAGNNRFFQKNFEWSDSLVEGGRVPSSLFHSFEESTLLVHQRQPMYLSNMSIEGNVVLVSTEAVYIGADAYLEDVLVYAPFVQIEAGFSGNAQFFASDTLLVGENVLLQYPSTLAVLADKTQERAFLKVEKGAIVEGVVLLQTASSGRKNRALLSIQKSAIVEGQVFSNQRVELKGSVYGSVACRKFYLKTSASIYENHLLNATIDETQRSPFFVGTDIFGETAKRKLVKWLE